MSLRTKLQNKIKAEGRLTYGAMCQFVVEEGYKVDTGTRELRHLMEEGLIDKEEAISKRGTKYISAYVDKAIPKSKEVTRYRTVMKNGELVAESYKEIVSI